MKHSDYSLIPTFVAIIEEKSYSSAAKRLAISQSAVSQAVNRLQDVFKDQLFVRVSRGVEPTQFALDIYPTLSNAVENIAYMTPEYLKFEPLSYSSKFIISAFSAFGFIILPELSLIMSKEAPSASIKIEPLYHNDIVGMLRTQQLDLVLDIHVNESSQLRSKVIMQDTVSVICRADHPRLTGSHISVEQFLAEKHVTHSHFENKDAYIMGRGYKEEALLGKRQVAWQAGSIMEILPVVERCEHIALLPQILVEKYSDVYDLKVLKQTFLSEPIEVAIYWHPSRSNDPRHQWLRKQIVKAAKQFEDSYI